MRWVVVGDTVTAERDAVSAIRFYRTVEGRYASPAVHGQSAWRIERKGAAIHPRTRACGGLHEQRVGSPHIDGIKHVILIQFC
jgi:hypothetical protein